MRVRGTVFDDGGSKEDLGSENVEWKEAKVDGYGKDEYNVVIPDMSETGEAVERNPVVGDLKENTVKGGGNCLEVFLEKSFATIMRYSKLVPIIIYSPLL
uniref:Uncharacterized protein n=1 Tax=Rhabditophanes sp. KR3021 TaxID=114890 RepID=A0AC35UBP5_9BILA